MEVSFQMIDGRRALLTRHGHLRVVELEERTFEVTVAGAVGKVQVGTTANIGESGARARCLDAQHKVADTTIAVHRVYVETMWEDGCVFVFPWSEHEFPFHTAESKGVQRHKNPEELFMPDYHPTTWTSSRILILVITLLGLFALIVAAIVVSTQSSG